MKPKMQTLKNQSKIDKITSDKEKSEAKLKALMDEMNDKNAKLVSDLKEKLANKDESIIPILKQR